MFKKLLLPFCLLLFLSQAFAAIYIVEPVDRTFLPVHSDEVFFGKVARGETLKVVVKKKSGLEQDWLGLKVDEQFLPSNWQVKAVDSDKTLVCLITIPVNAQTSTQRLRFIAKSPSGNAFDEAFYASVSVQPQLLSASIENLNQQAIVGQEAKFNLVLNNDSVAGHAVAVQSTLPGYWFSTQTIALEPNETRTVELNVMPYSYGEKNFSFTVSSLQNEANFSFPARLDVKPTLLGMFQVGAAGFPFFSPSLLSSYLLNAILSLF